MGRKLNLVKIALVNPPRSLYERGEIAPPLGLLTLAKAAQFEGVEVSLIDFNLLCQVQPELRGESFYENAIDRLLAEGASVYGFTSMAVDSHVALHLARLLKQAQPDVTNVLGGPHFSSIANEVLENYPWIDFVIRGEAETTFGNLIRDLRTKQNSKSRSVVSLGSGKHEGVSPAYDLVNLGLYYNVNPRRSLNFEGGRGCRFKCSFCYSPGHYNGARTFAIDSKIKELSNLVDLGAKHVFFVEDNFLNEPRHAIAFSKELQNAGLDLTWNCYVTLPQLSGEVIAAMAKGGCTGVFAGVDAVGELTQRTLGKRFLRGETALAEKLAECVGAGITPTCAFLLSPPSHPCGGDTEQTLRVALTARNCGAEVRLNTLTLYNQTKLQREFDPSVEVDETKVRLMLDVPKTVERNEYAKANPRLFPFHARYVPSPEWALFVSRIHCLFTLLACYPMTLDYLWSEKDISPVVIANSILVTTGDLVSIEKQRRRDVELLAAINVLEELTTGSKTSQALMENESENLLSS
jgi:hypothetical protein